MFGRFSNQLGVAFVLLSGWCSAVFGETAVVRSSFENILVPIGGTASNSVVGAAAGVGGHHWQAAHDTNLAQVQLGAPCGALEASYGVGDEIEAPDGAADGAVPILVSADNVVWLDYAELLLAVDSGAAVIQWEMADGTTNTMTYVISSNPSKRGVRLYWTDDENGRTLQNAGPTVEFGSNYKVTLFASSSISIHEDDYQWSYGDSAVQTNDVWLDGTYLHAKEGAEGKFLLVYSRTDEYGFEQYLGHEVVEVLEPMSELQSVRVGDRLKPVKRSYEIDDLFSLVARGATDDTGENPDDIFVYKHGTGDKNGWIWAIRETEAAWQIEIYWKAQEELDVIWPFEVDIYDVSWGDDLQHYVRGDLAGGDLEPKVYISSELSVEVMPYQTVSGESGASDEFAFAEDGELYTEKLGKFLLKYVADETVWFEPVEAVDHASVEMDAWAWEIASRLEPADSACTNWPGYLYTPSGSAYNTNYYMYPEEYLEEESGSSIYAVNEGLLEVWWANVSRYYAMTDVEDDEIRLGTPLYFPSMVSVYSNVWPEAADQIVVAGGLGNEGLTCILDASPVLQCDGAGDEIPDSSDLGSWSASDPFTLEAWVKPTEVSGTVLEKENGWSLGFSTNGVSLMAEGETVFSSGIQLRTNAWQHLALSRDSDGTLRFFLNGAKEAVVSCTHALVSDASVYMGAFAGDLEEVRIWDEARSEDEIRTLMHRALMGSDPVPAYYASFDDLDLYQSIDTGAWLKDSYKTLMGDANDYGDGGFTGGDYFRTQGNQNSCTVTLAELPEHSSLAIGMCLAQIRSLDPPNDWISITVDGDEVFHVCLGLYENQEFRLNGVAADTSLLEEVHTVTMPDEIISSWSRRFYDLSQLEALQNIPHTSETATIVITAYTDQGWSDEGYAFDNLSVSLNWIADGQPTVRPGLSLAGTSPKIYVQNDSESDGYNPNEEHALVLQDTVYALRTDLNVTNETGYTSDPFVLVEYTDADGNPDMAIFEVVASNKLYAFEQFLDAGQMIPAPAPLNQMVPAWCSDNEFVQTDELDPFEDRTGRFWAQHAGGNGESVATVANLYYPSQSGFWYPDGESVAAGDPVALAAGAASEPVGCTYTVSWPEDVPNLYVGDTLTTTKDGLPAVRGQLSVDVLYQQSVALGDPNSKSVKLIDPTRARKAAMDGVPDAIDSYRDTETGYTFFSDLPPALRERMFWNGTASSGEEFQLKGEFVARTDGNNYLLLNVLSQSNRVNALDPDIVDGADDPDWISAIAGLPETVYEITDDDTPVDSYALSTVGRGSGYVTLIFNDSTNETMVASSEVIDMVVIRVEPELYCGELDTIESVNPLDKQLTLKYTADFAGEPAQFEFEWNVADPDNGSAPDEDSASWLHFAKTNGLHYTTIGDSGVFGLSDHYLRCRYRALDESVQAVVGTNWSSWTSARLAEGWIKRVMSAINPYEQSITDYMNYEIDTTLSMVAQAGAPYNGDIALNYESLNDYGLIQIYETVYKQALDLCANEEVSGSLSLALLMVSGRLADFYTLLGNEAYADALNPTVTLGSDDPLECMEMTSIFCFQNQMTDLLSEELALLRGRDDTCSPDVTDYPIYNRLVPNFTSDTVGGEVAYMLNYGISDIENEDGDGAGDGSIDEYDALALFPQGHGDAWGHYLKAMKYYYAAMHADNFHWFPQVEGVMVADSEVTVSYLHEKKFAVAAAAKAEAGLEVLSKTWRQDYVFGEELSEDLFDSNTNRAWGVAEWASRAGQGAYFDWLAANSLLPDSASEDEEGIRVIDRETTPELDEIAAFGSKIQQQLDHIDAGLNPLGLAENVIPFDISSSEIDAGETHFEQVYKRAESALITAAEIFDRVQTCAQALRDQNEDGDFTDAYEAEEAEYTRRLIALYGYPYSDDLGPGELYDEYYSGPDLLHYNYIERYDDLGEITEYSLDVVSYESCGFTEGTYSSSIATDDALSEAFDTEVDEVSVLIPDVSTVTNSISFCVDSAGLPCKPVRYTGRRRAEGEIQIALSSYVERLSEVSKAYEACEQAKAAVEEMASRLSAKYLRDAGVSAASAYYGEKISSYESIQSRIETAIEVEEIWHDVLSSALDSASEVAPTTAGFSVDIGTGVRAIVSAIAEAEDTASATYQTAQFVVMDYLEEKISGLEGELEDAIGDAEGSYELALDLLDMQQVIAAQDAPLLQLKTVLQAAETARMEYSAAVAEGDALQQEREAMRINYAADLSAKRYRNMAYMIMRNDELDRYTETFDAAARYCYLAAKAYDYETGLLDAESSETTGAEFLADVVTARTIGRMSRDDGNNPEEPLVGSTTGEPGLADILARMKANWEVLDGRLGFNNPQTETGRFSLRTELFRIKPSDVGGADSDKKWREKLESFRVDNLLDLEEFQRCCLPFTPADPEEPALVIPFSTEINFGNNFFGLSLAGGDNAYDSTYFATKIRSAGVWFSNFDNAFNGGLANQPRVYLIPVGVDKMRVPSSDMDEIREFQVVDQALPVPYSFSEDDWESSDWSAAKDMLGDELFDIRRYPSMRSYHDSGEFDDSELINNSRLIGRSVWNTRWLLIIPGGTLLDDGEEGIDRFIHGTEVYPGIWDEDGVSDIKIFFQTYSYSGN